MYKCLSSASHFRVGEESTVGWHHRSPEDHSYFYTILFTPASVPLLPVTCHFRPWGFLSCMWYKLIIHHDFLINSPLFKFSSNYSNLCMSSVSCCDNDWYRNPLNILWMLKPSFKNFLKSQNNYNFLFLYSWTQPKLSIHKYKRD